MEQVLKATQEQYEALNGYTVENNRLEFFKDADGNWITGINVLRIPAFKTIRATLTHELERIDHNPLIQEDDE